MRRDIRSVSILFRYFFSEDTTLVLVWLMSFYPHNLNSREEFAKLLFWNSLIIAEGEEIRRSFANRGKYIARVSEDDFCTREVLLHYLHTRSLIVDRVSSFSRKYSMISCNHDRHISREFRRFSEIILMSRMENIERPEAHDMAIYCAIFRK